MKSITKMTTIGLALATALFVPAAMAQTAPKSKCVPPVGENCPGAKNKKATAKASKPAPAAEEPTDKQESAVETPPQMTEKPTEMPMEQPAEAPPPTPPPEAYGGGPMDQQPPPPPAPMNTMPTTTTTTVMQTTTTDDTSMSGMRRSEDHRRVRRGLGINGFGSGGARDDARWGLGGRVEYVLPFGLAFGGSYTVHWESEGDRTAVRPLLGEVGWSIPIVKNFEVRPMVGLGWAFAKTERSTYVNDQGQTVTTRAGVSDGFDVAPGAKISYLASVLEVYTMPKYHFISGNNFAAIELGAGARF